MSKVTEEQKMHHYMGIEMNIQTWSLLGKEDRNEQDNAGMVNFVRHHYMLQSLNLKSNHR